MNDWEAGISALERLWPFGVFLLTALISFVIGRERQRWRVDVLGKRLTAHFDTTNERMERMEARLTELEKNGAGEAVSVAVLISKQDVMLEMMKRLEHRLDNVQEHRYGSG